jgi:gamma-glutamylputrescine oxidase
MSWLYANGDRGQYPDSVYASYTDPIPAFEPLKRSHDADVCVVGGGLTGLSAALHAAKAGHQTILLDAQRIGWGASGRNGGQISGGLNWDQRRLEARIGNEAAKDIWRLCQEACTLTRGLIGRYAPECNYVPGHVSATSRDDEFADARSAASHLQDTYGAQLRVLDKASLSDLIGTEAYVGGVLDEGAGFCNPLALTMGVARACIDAGVKIYEGSEVNRIQGTKVKTVQGEVTARHIIHATNGYGTHLTPAVASRALPINNYIAATAPLGDNAPMSRPLAVSDTRFVVNYFHQTPDGRLVYGGGESYGRRFPKDIEQRVRKNLARVYPDQQSVPLPYHWGGTLAVTATRLPYLAEVSPNIFAAGGYSGHGLALSSLFGKLIIEAIGGRRDRFHRFANLPVPSLLGGRWLGSLATTAALAFGALQDRVRYG